MKEFIEKLIGRLEEYKTKAYVTGITNNPYEFGACNAMDSAIKIVNELAEEYINTSTNKSSGWISALERLPECENKYGWVSCIVSVIRSHYPTSTYDICDAPYDENIVMYAKYNVSQKIWHLECDEQLNALLDIEDAPMNCDYVIAWQPLPQSYAEQPIWKQKYNEQI